MYIDQNQVVAIDTVQTSFAENIFQVEQTFLRYRHSWYFCFSLRSTECHKILIPEEFISYIPMLRALFFCPYF